MSADLELRQQDLLQIRLPPPEMSNSDNNSNNNVYSPSSEITDDGNDDDNDDGIRSSTSSSGTGQEGEENNNNNNNSCQVTPARKATATATATAASSSSEEESNKTGGQSCRTPSSPGHMIPEILSCPPAPKKQRASAVSCKRKLVFFDQVVVARDEIDSFFRQFAIDVVNSKRRCLV